MEKDIAEGKIGEVGAYDFEFKEGKLRLKVELSKDSEFVNAKADLTINVPARPLLEALKRAIPGVWDDAAIELAAKALGV